MKRIIMVALSAVSIHTMANPTIDGIWAKPSIATAGEPVSVTFKGTDSETGICAFSVNWGDGSPQVQTKTGRPHRIFPITYQHTYAKPGTYTISAYGKRSGTYLKCLGKAAYKLKVEDATTAAQRNQKCPSDWRISSKTVDGTFTCLPARKGAAKPAKPIACPTGTSYFVNNRALGCERL